MLAAEPAHPVALNLLGVVSTQRGDPRRAVELIGRALVLRPNGAAMHVNMADAYRHLGDLTRAAGCCQTALCLRPEFPEGLNTLGLVRRDQGRLEEALAPFRRVLELNPDSLPPRTNLSLTLLDLGRADDALALCEEAVLRQPDVAILHHNVGNVLRVMDRVLEARASYLEALRLDPELALAHLHMGMTLRREGRFHEALPWYCQAIDLDGHNPFFWEQLADLHSDRDEPGDAVACWRRAIELAPTTRPGVHVGLGWALQEEGRLDEAVAQYQSALSLDGAFAPALLHLGGARRARRACRGRGRVSGRAGRAA